jgi:hypothetical protein
MLIRKSAAMTQALRSSAMLIAAISLLITYATAATRGPTCDPSDPVFVCGLHHPEDIVRLPGTPWIVASSINFTMGNPPSNIGPGPLSAIRIDTHAVRRLYPTASSVADWDRENYRDCPAPPSMFSSHGLNVRPLGKGKYRLYVANHGSRESVEVIDVTVRGERLNATWRGCMRVSVKDLGIWPNAVVPLPDGGVALAGYNVAIWHSGRGWEKFQSYQGMKPGEHDGVGFANGVEVSRDGRWIYIADTGRTSVIRVPVGGGPQTEMKLSFVPDNLRWGEDGLLYVAGPIFPKWTESEAHRCYAQAICVTGIGVASIDPQTLAVNDVVHDEVGIKDKFGTPTTALQMGTQLWISTSRGDRVMIVGLKP